MVFFNILLMNLFHLSLIFLLYKPLRFKLVLFNPENLFPKKEGFQSSIDAEEESRQILKLQRKVMPMASSWTEEERKRATELPLRLGLQLNHPQHRLMLIREARVLLFDLPILMLQNSDAKLVLNYSIQTGEAFYLEFMRDWLQHLASEEKKKKSKGDTFLSIFMDTKRGFKGHAEPPFKEKIKELIENGTLKKSVKYIVVKFLMPRL
uniref:Uncharacterized protein n=1 Tax=Brassica oleracea var. oleracea TaxID=109376 RepID=A0A0D3BDW2_BRAOL